MSNENNRDTATLRLYVAGHSAKSARAVRIVRREWQAERDGFEDVELVDVLANPEAAAAAGVAITPTLVAHTAVVEARCFGRAVLDPEKVRRVIRSVAGRPEGECGGSADAGSSPPAVVMHLPRKGTGPLYRMELYVNGGSARALELEARVRDFCDARWFGAYELELIDVLADPIRARKAGIVATPTLVAAGPDGAVRSVGHRSLEREELAVRLDDVRTCRDADSYPRRVIIVEAGDRIATQLDPWLRANKLPFARFSDADTATDMLLSLGSGTLRAVIVVDLATIGHDGLRKLGAFIELRPGAYHVIVLTAEPDATEEMLCLQMGVSEYLRRDLPSAEIFAHVRPLMRLDVEPTPRPAAA